MDLVNYRLLEDLTERELASKILDEMGVSPDVRAYERKLRNMVEYVKRWESKACRPSDKYRPHVIAATKGQVTANSFYE